MTDTIDFPVPVQAEVTFDYELGNTGDETTPPSDGAIIATVHHLWLAGDETQTDLWPTLPAVAKCIIEAALEQQEAGRIAAAQQQSQVEPAVIVEADAA